MAKRIARTVMIGGGGQLARLSYAHLFEPHSMQEGQPPKYSLMLLIPKTDTETTAAVGSACQEVMQEAAASGMWGGRIPPALHMPLRDGDAERPDDPAYAGMWFMNASSRMRPGVVDRECKTVMVPEDVYSGCYGRAQVTLFAYDSMGNRGIGAGLNHVQKVQEGPRLGGGGDPAKVFSAFDNSRFAEAAPGAETDWMSRAEPVDISDIF